MKDKIRLCWNGGPLAITITIGLPYSFIFFSSFFTIMTIYIKNGNHHIRVVVHYQLPRTQPHDYQESILSPA